MLTSRNEQQSRLRAHTIEVMRMSSVIENDIAALENAQRGYLLTHEHTYVQSFARYHERFQKHTQELGSIIHDQSLQRKRLLNLREIVWKWSSQTALAMHKDTVASPAEPVAIRAALDAPLLDEGREILHSIQREEQIDLNQRVRDQEWAVQSMEVLDFIPRLERAVSEMQKEKRGYLLTGDPVFIESYKRATANFYTFQGHLSVLVANSTTQTSQLDRIRLNLEHWIIDSAVPDIETKRAGRNPSAASRKRGEELMANVRRLMDGFAKEQMEIYRVRAAAATHERILTTSGIDVLCGLAALLMIASSCYSFIVYRRQFGKLKSADVRIRSVIDNILDGMITIDDQGSIYSMNPAAKRMFGYSEDEDAYFGDAFTQIIPKVFGLAVGGALCPCEWTEFTEKTGGVSLALAQTRNRANFPVEISLSAMISDEKKFYIAMVRDITERRRFEEELAAERNSLAVTLGSICDGVITTDVNGRILISNPACEALTGWPAGEAIGQKLKTVLNIAADGAAQRRNQPASYRSEAEAILLGTPERSILTARDGTQRTIEQVAAPIYDRKKQLSGVVLVFRDITQRLRDEAERRKAEALDQLGLLAGGIAHDFNNLLTSIIGNISLISMVLPPNDEMNGRLNDAKNASLRARDLAQQLLTFARGGAPIKKTASITKLIEDTVSFSLRGSHSRSELTIAPDLWPAEFDPGQISQVIANLVVNADQAMPNGGTLHVSCENFTTPAELPPALHCLPPGDYIRIAVRDEGVGIPEKCLKRIFDPYFTTKETGNGLGLATTYSVIKNHGGLITVESAEYQGATFTIYLPAASHEVAPKPIPMVNPPNEKAAEKINDSGRVLIVDDEEAIRALVDFTLGRMGYEVSEAGTAIEGVELYRKALESGRRFDLVILDLTLPGGMGGKEALKQLIEIDPTVTAVVSSGYATDATMSRYEDLGFRGVITKPYEAAELGRTV
ncbi:MAG TPA: CHASE3 domain-containing protein, partial [Chthoniobacterales bacterium]